VSCGCGTENVAGVVATKYILMCRLKAPAATKERAAAEATLMGTQPHSSLTSCLGPLWDKTVWGNGQM
jgi:hypothetical protein